MSYKKGGRNNIAIAQHEIDKMVKYLKDGKTLECVGQIMKLHPTTIFRYTKDIVGKRGYKRVLKSEILEELKKGKNSYQVAHELGTGVERVERLARDNKKIIPIKESMLSKRELEVKKLCEEVQRQKMKMKKEFEADLKKEKEDLANRFKGIVK